MYAVLCIPTTGDPAVYAPLESEHDARVFIEEIDHYVCGNRHVFVEVYAPDQMVSESITRRNKGEE